MSHPSAKLASVVVSWNVAWTRGQGCQPLAELLADGSANAVRDDLSRACVTERIDLLVARRLTSFDLVPLVVPHSLDLDAVESVTVAVSDGPHSPLAAEVADRIASTLSVDWEIVTAYRDSSEMPEANGRLARLAERHPSAKQEAFETRHATDLTDRLSPKGLLVLGAAGGSWLQRQFFGPGHRLTVAAPGGAVAVRSAPRRCFHALDDRHGAVVGPHMLVVDARRVFDLAAIPVAEAGHLVGVVRASTLAHSPDDATVGDVMEPPVSVAAKEPLAAAVELAEFLDGGPVPVTGSDGDLMGVVELPDEPGADFFEL